jgi:hypothetical protein
MERLASRRLSESQLQGDNVRKPAMIPATAACNLEVAGRLSPRRGGTRAARRRLAWRYPM